MSRLLPHWTTGRRAAPALLTLGILPVVLTGCSGEDQPDTSSPTTPDGVAVADEAGLITISGFAYSQTGTVEPGGEISVTNEDNVGHTVTSDEDGLFDVAVGPGETVTFTVPDEPGEYSYFCIPHPTMVSVLTVG